MNVMYNHLNNLFILSYFEWLIEIRVHKFTNIIEEAMIIIPTIKVVFMAHNLTNLSKYIISPTKLIIQMTISGEVTILGVEIDMTIIRRRAATSIIFSVWWTNHGTDVVNLEIVVIVVLLMNALQKRNQG